MRLQGEGDSDNVSADSFETLAICGNGAYGRVLMVRSKADSRIYAMKCVDKTNVVQKGNNSITQAIAENELLQMMDHEYVVSLHCAFQDKVNLYMVLDYAGGGDMFALIDKRRRLPEDWVRIYAAELVLALEHCHAKGIVYRDLKPENVMITLDGHVLLTDFGLSKKLGDPSLPDDKLRTRTVCGTPSYMAPEALSGRPYGRAVDWWTLGCVIYEMAVGAQPFAADALAALVRKVTSGSYQVPPWLSPELTSLIKALMHLDTSVRLGSSAGGVAKLKAHAFFAPIDWDALSRKEVPAPQMPGSATDVTAPTGPPKVADPSKGLLQLEQGFRKFERSRSAGSHELGSRARTALDGLSLELSASGTVVGVSKRLAHLLRVRREPRPADDADGADAFVVGRRLVDLRVLDRRDRGAVKQALADVLASAHAGESAPEAPAEISVRLWVHGGARPAESEAAGAGEGGIVSADDAEVAAQLLAEGSAMRIARLRFSAVPVSEPAAETLGPSAGVVARRSHDDSTSDAGSQLSSAPTAAPFAVAVSMTDCTAVEQAKALVRRRYQWAYEQRLGADELAKVLSPQLDFEESATKASLAVSASAEGARGSGFSAYVERRDRFLRAFPDMLRTIQSIDVSDDGAQALTHWRWEGTHTGEYAARDYDGTLLLLAPTQAAVICSGVSIDGIRDGLIVRHQTFFDEAALRAQLTRERMSALRARDGGGSATAGALEAIRKAPSAPPLDAATSAELIATACGDGLALVDTAELPARFLYANGALLRATGYSAAELCGSPAGVKLLQGAMTSRGSSERLDEALRSAEPSRLLIALRAKDEKTFVALIALAVVKPTDELLVPWRARALYSAALAAEAVAAEAEDEGDISAHAAALLGDARRDAGLLAKLEGGQLCAMAVLDMSYMPADLAADAQARAAGEALAGARSNANAAAAGEASGAGAEPRPEVTWPASAREAAQASRGAYSDLQPSLMGVPRHMGVLPKKLRDMLALERTRAWPDGSAHSADAKADPPAAPARAAGRPAAAPAAEQPPPSTEQLLLRTCVESDGYAVVISEMCSRDQPLVYINPGFAAVTQYESADCLGHNCRFLQSNLTDPSAVMLLKWSIAAREPCRVHLLNVTRLGRPFWNLLSLHPAVEENGRADYFLGVQVELDAQELQQLLVEVHRWQRMARADAGT